MKNIYKTFIVLAAAISMCGCAQKDDGDLGHHHHDHAHSPAHKHSEAEGHDHDEEEGEKEARAGEIVLEPEIAEKFGVATSKASIGDFNEVIEVSGQIVDTPHSSSMVSAPTSGIVKFAPGIMPGKQVAAGAVVARVSASGMSGGDSNAAAKAAFDAAKKELDRLQPLYAEKLVTASTYQAAVQAYEIAKAGYSSQAASGAARAVTSGVITELLAQEGQYVNAGDAIANVSSNVSLTLRADLPEKYYNQLSDISTANIVLPYSGAVVSLDSLGGKRESSGRAVSATRGYLPVFFSFSNNGEVLPGSYVQVKLIGASRNGVLSVPASALSEQQGAYFVYERLDDECYRKIPVRIGMNNGSQVEILSGLKGDEEIVSDGVMGVRLAESSGVVPEGHSHNH